MFTSRHIDALEKLPQMEYCERAPRMMAKTARSRRPSPRRCGVDVGLMAMKEHALNCYELGAIKFDVKITRSSA